MGGRARAMVVAALLATLAAPVALAAETASYEITVELDAPTHRLLGIEELRWTNTTSVATSELDLHLYLNAFSSSRSTFMRELGGEALRFGPPTPAQWGWIRITRLESGEGDDLLPALEVISPDDGNPDDRTVARLALPRAVEPGQSVSLSLTFEAQLPSVIARTGFAGDFHMVGQWYPLLGVFEGESGWACHQFHAASEFYADFASYRVVLKVPEGWVVGATGSEVERSLERAGSGTHQRVVFQADKVHDFAWCAAPAELMAVVDEEFEPGRDVPLTWLEEAAALLGVSAAELELPPTHLRLLVPRSQLTLVPRMLAAARRSIAWLGLRLGPYPYPQLTIVSPPASAEEAWGMEYPTLITTGASRLLAYPPLSMLPFVESMTAHEYGHQYFQGLLASDEFEEAWLDEGLTSWVENECVAAMLALGGSSAWPPETGWASERLKLARSPVPLRIDRRAWEFRSRGDYGTASYTKTALALRTLEGLLGRDVLARGLRTYFERQRFTHPRGADLLAAFEEASGEDLGWFFDQVVEGDAEADWAVVRVDQRRRRRATGLVFEDGEWRAPAVTGDDPGGWAIEVHLARLGELIGPVEVELGFADGRSERRRWESGERWVKWRLDSPELLDSVVVDPDGVWALEVERANNYWRRRPPERVRRPLWWVAPALEVVAAVLVPWS